MRGIKRAWLTGGGRLAGSFQDARLISGYVISVIPVLLGAGVPLFAGTPSSPHGLHLQDSVPFPNGAVQLTYSA